jgi:Fe-S cluster assembly iron-binding protein IscA
MNTSKRAARVLNEKLTGMFYAEDIGFRVKQSAELSDPRITISLDKKGPEDEVLEASGVKLLLDPVSAAALRNYELDFKPVPEAGFLIKKCREKSPSKAKKPVSFQVNAPIT